MNELKQVFDVLCAGYIVIFVKDSGEEQSFKLIDDILHEFKDGQWNERMYLPRWNDMLYGNWFY